MKLNALSSTERPITATTDGSTSRATRRVLAVIHLTMLMLSLTVIAACSTTEGFGEDVKDLGGNIEDSAARNK